MPVTRMACLAALTLVASTLPAIVWPAPPAREEQESRSSPDTSVPGKPNNHEDDSPPTLQLVLNADVWDGGSARAANTGIVPLAAAPLTGHDPGSGTGPSDPNTFARAETHMPDERSQRRWLTCRYAHAPPVGA